jgi:hypothetical protein
MELPRKARRSCRHLFLDRLGLARVGAAVEVAAGRDKRVIKPEACGFGHKSNPAHGIQPALGRGGDMTMDAAGGGRGEVEDRRQLAAVFEELLEISAGGRVRDWQFQQRVSDPADAGFKEPFTVVSSSIGFVRSRSW